MNCPGQFRERPDEVLFNCMIDMCVRFRDLYGAVSLFNQMDRSFSSNVVNYPPQKYHNRVHNSNFHTNSGKRGGGVVRPWSVQPSAVTYGIIIKAYGQENQLENAFKIFQEMKRARLVPSSMTYGCLLQACVKNDDIRRACSVFEAMKEDRVAMNTVIYTTMIKAYQKSYQLEKALELYETMLEEMQHNKDVAPNIVTFNSLLDCCVRCFDVP